MEFSPRSLREPILDADPAYEALKLMRKLTGNGFRADAANSFTPAERSILLSPQSPDETLEVSFKNIAVKQRVRPEAFYFTIRATHSTARAALLIADRYALTFVNQKRAAASRSWVVNLEYLRARLETARAEVKGLETSLLEEQKSGLPEPVKHEENLLNIARFQFVGLQERIKEGKNNPPLMILGPARLE